MEGAGSAFEPNSVRARWRQPRVHQCLCMEGRGQPILILLSWKLIGQMQRERVTTYTKSNHAPAHFITRREEPIQGVLKFGFLKVSGGAVVVCMIVSSVFFFFHSTHLSIFFPSCLHRHKPFEADLIDFSVVESAILCFFEIHTNRKLNRTEQHRR